jgi:hypothetical protein
MKHLFPGRPSSHCFQLRTVSSRRTLPPNLACRAYCFNYTGVDTALRKHLVWHLHYIY